MNRRGWEQLCQGRHHEALEDFSRAIELDEELAEAYNNRSIARRLEGVEGAAQDEDLADALTMHDLEAPHAAATAAEVDVCRFQYSRRA